MQRLEAVRGVPGGLHLLSVRFTYLVLTIPTQPVTLCTGAASLALPGVAGTFDRPLPTVHANTSSMWNCYRIIICGC